MCDKCLYDDTEPECSDCVYYDDACCMLEEADTECEFESIV